MGIYILFCSIVKQPNTTRATKVCVCSFKKLTGFFLCFFFWQEDLGEVEEDQLFVHAHLQQCAIKGHRQGRLKKLELEIAAAASG